MLTCLWRSSSLLRLSFYRLYFCLQGPMTHWKQIIQIIAEQLWLLLPFNEQLLQLAHGPSQQLWEHLDLVEGQVEVLEAQAAGRVPKGQGGLDAVAGHIEGVQRRQGQQLHREAVQMVSLEVQTSQALQTLANASKKRRHYEFNHASVKSRLASALLSLVWSPVSQWKEVLGLGPRLTVITQV